MIKTTIFDIQNTYYAYNIDKLTNLHDELKILSLAYEDCILFLDKLIEYYKKYYLLYSGLDVMEHRGKIYIDLYLQNNTVLSVVYYLPRTVFFYYSNAGRLTNSYRYAWNKVTERELEQDKLGGILWGMSNGIYSIAGYSRIANAGEESYFLLNPVLIEG